MQCRLEHIDLSSNSFITNPEVHPTQNEFGAWELYINSLTHLAAKAMLKHKLFYSANIIPWTLVDFLDNANMCVCGNPVVSDKCYIIKEFELKDYYRSVVFDNNRNSSVGFECFFCSSKCFFK